VLKAVEMMLGLGLTHSRLAHPKPDKPEVCEPEMIHAMIDAAVAFQTGGRVSYGDDGS
jgi:hypothetical protein